MDNFRLTGLELLILQFLETQREGRVQYTKIAEHLCDKGRTDDCVFLGPTLRDLRREHFILDELGPELDGRVYTITSLGSNQLAQIAAER